MDRFHRTGTVVVFMLGFLGFSTCCLHLQAMPQQAPDQLSIPDGVLRQVIGRLPAGWSLNISGSLLTIERQADSWVAFVNRLNAPASKETPEARQERLRKTGKKQKTRLVFQLEPLWTAEKILQVKKDNADLYQQMAHLAEKLGVKHLINARLSKKGEEVLIPSTPEEQKHVVAYEAEKSRLAAKMQSLPEFNTQTFSLFGTAREGLSDEFHDVIPDEASTEAFQILTILNELNTAQSK